MEYVSLAVGLGLGFYFRNTPLARHVGNRLFASYYKIIKRQDINYKLVLVVRQDIRMPGREIASQCSHAAVLAYQNTLKRDPTSIKLWDASDSAKVVLKAKDKDSFTNICKKASELGVITHIYPEIGFTNDEAGAKKVLAVGPGPVKKIDEATKHLKLL